MLKKATLRQNPAAMSVSGGRSPVTKRGVRPWSLRSRYSLAGDSLAFAASTPQCPTEIYVRTATGERQLTDLNASWRAEVELTAPEHFTVPSGGWELDAWVMRPAGFVPGQRYPTLVNIHGGPFAQYGRTFFDEFQVQAGTGYAVVFCNPRGSSGRDDAFARAIIGCPGEPDSADVLAALDEALQRYDFLDPTRLVLPPESKVPEIRPTNPLATQWQG
jgi:dipeptidyl aminopeptidase/acylaminoacyl peptidase